MASMANEGVRVREGASRAKRMGSHVAYALVLYTLLLIFAVSPQMESEGTSIFPYFLLVILVGLVIMPCRSLEHRWKALDAAEAGDESQFRRDIVKLWLGAIGLPALLGVILWILP